MRKTTRVRLLAALLSLLLLAGMLLSSCGAKTPEESFLDLQKQELSAAAENLGTVFSSFNAGQSSDASGRVLGNVTLSFGPTARAFLSASSGNIDLDWLSSISLKMDISSKKNLAGGVASLLLGTTEIVGMNLWVDNETRELRMTIPELSDTVLSLSQDSLSDSVGSIDQSALLSALPDAKTIRVLVERYSDLILAEFKTVTESEEDFTAGEVTKTLKVLRSEMTAGEVAEILKKVLETIKTDKEIETIIRDIAALIPEGDTPDEVYAEFLSGLQDVIDSIEVDQDDNEKIIYELLVDGKKIVGRRLNVSDRELYLYFLEKDENFGFACRPMVLYDYEKGNGSLDITGSGKVKDGVYSGSFSLALRDAELLKLELTRYDRKAAEKGKLDFDCTLKPTINLIQLISDEDVSSLALLTVYSLHMKVLLEEEAFSFYIGLMQGTEEFLGYTVDGRSEKTAGEIPELTGPALNIMDEDSMSQYASGIRFDTILSNLQKAGVPAELLSELLGGFMQ